MKSKVIQALSFDDRLRTARSSWAGAKTLEVLSRDSSEEIRLAVAENSKASRKALLTLMEDSDKEVRRTAKLALHKQQGG